MADSTVCDFDFNIVVAKGVQLKFPRLEGGSGLVGCLCFAFSVAGLSAHAIDSFLFVCLFVCFYDSSVC